MKLQFEANQQFQLDAIAAVTGLFIGQPRSDPAFSVIRLANDAGLFAGQELSELGLGNHLLLSTDTLRSNLRTIQRRNDIEANDDAAIEGWSLFDAPANEGRLCPHFGRNGNRTGKTYVYLRTIFELSKRYGFTKFVIVVPSVAIREGVLKTLEITGEHFRALYDNNPVEYFVYDAKRQTGFVSSRQQMQFRS